MAMMRGQRTLEINPDHPLIVGLRDKVTDDKEDESAKAMAALLYETALLESGFELDDPKVRKQCHSTESMPTTTREQYITSSVLDASDQCMII